jgi:hypothetical protein
MNWCILSFRLWEEGEQLLPQVRIHVCKCSVAVLNTPLFGLCLRIGTGALHSFDSVRAAPLTPRSLVCNVMEWRVVSI